MATKKQSLEIAKCVRTWKGLERLVREAVPEGARLDYKRDPYRIPLVGGDPKDRYKERLELCRDATSFSNGGGGYIVIGIEENEHAEASALCPAVDVKKFETQFRDLLHEYVQPRSAIEKVFSVRSPKKDGSGVIVIHAAAAQPQQPAAALNDGTVEFWMRFDRSKRKMTYDEIEKAFRLSEEAELKRKIDAAAVLEVRNIKWKLHKAARAAKGRSEQEWGEVVQIASGLFPYLSEHGLPVRDEAVRAVREIVYYPRRGISLEAVEEALGILENALPVGIHWQLPSEKPLEEGERNLVRDVVNTCFGLLWDAVRYLDDAKITFSTLELYAQIMHWAHLNKDEEVMEKIRADLDRTRKVAVEEGREDGRRLIDFVLKHGVLLRPDWPLLPPDLEEKIYPDSGLHGSRG